MNRLVTAGLLALAAAAPAQEDAREAAFRSRVAFLASDDMRGRETGSADYDRAAAWVADQFAHAGVRPAGASGGYLQPVPLVTARPADQGAMSVDGTALTFGTDYLPSVAVNSARVAIDAPMVFAGYGASAPSQGHDDYAGLDVRGKVVVVFSGAPRDLQGEIRAHLGNGATKSAEAARRGAVALLTLYSPTQDAVTPFARRVPGWNQTRMAWRTTAGAGFDPGGLPGVGVLSESGTAKLFAGQAPLLAQLRAAERAGTAFPRVTLPGMLHVRFTNTLGRAESSNVVGLIPGSDSRLRNEYVVLSAHLDHLGVGAAENGDSIYNGAMDNATGIATLLGVAERFRRGPAPRRSMLLVAVTGEEKGEIGSDYFVRHPVRPARSLVADVNLDMPILLWDFTDVVAFGGDRSGIGPIARAALAPLGIAVTPDQQPEEGLFTRSDQYRFVRAGIPAIALKPGPGNGGAAADRAFRRDHYHRPSDDMSLPIRWAQGVRFVDANYAIARGLADAPARPVWNRGDYFGTLFKGPMAAR